MATPRKPAGLVLCDGALAPNGRMQEAIEAAGWDDASLAAVLTAWASLDGHDVEVDHDALVAAIYAEDGLPGDEWLDFCAALGEGAEHSLIILAVASCWKKTGKTLAEVMPDTDRDRASERLLAKPRRARSGPRSARRGY